MFIDTRQLDEGAILRHTVCVVGAGMAGITMALEFERQGIDACVLESGGFASDEATLDMQRGASTGLPYAFDKGFRSRVLGGSSALWGGWCRTMSEREFQPREWVPESGWPIERRELEPFYERAHTVLKLGPMNYDTDWWIDQINRKDVRRLEFKSGKVTDELLQLSPPVRMGDDYRTQLQNAHNVTVYLHANALEFRTYTLNHAVKCVRVKTLTGKTVSVVADTFVLAAGGVENARLLLASRRDQSAGLGNQHDLVGRHFMDHPGLLRGTVRPGPSVRHNKLYDLKFHSHNPAVKALGTCVCGYLALTPETKRAEGLLDGFASLISVFPGEGTATEQALMQLYRALRMKEHDDMHLASAVATVLRDPLTTAAFGAAWLWQPPGLVSHQRLNLGIEQAPNPDCRITLSEELDALGVPRVKVDWKLGELEMRTFDRMAAIVGDELRAQGYEVELDAPLAETGWPDDISSARHHMGTTRMHESPRKGVVDPSGRVHGVTNLYVAGSSVMPTGSAHVPTATILAMALRLTDHLVALARKPAAPASRAAKARQTPLAA